MWRCWVVLACIMCTMSCGDDDCCTTSQDGAVNVADAPVDAPPSPRIVYLNRTGGTYSQTAGLSDAIDNSIRWIDMTYTFAAWPYDQLNWTAVTTCMVNGLRPFDIEVTEQDPSPAEHHEIVFTTGYPSVPSSIPAMTDSWNCLAERRNTITAVFGNAIGMDAQKACAEALAMFVVGSVGLDYVIDCRDFLGTSQSNCGAKSFVDAELKCGSMLERPCTCEGTTQNSHRKLLSIFGPRP